MFKGLKETYPCTWSCPHHYHELLVRVVCNYPTLNKSHHNYHIKIIFEMESLAMLAQVYWHLWANIIPIANCGMSKRPRILIK